MSKSAAPRLAGTALDALDSPTSLEWLNEEAGLAVQLDLEKDEVAIGQIATDEWAVVSVAALPWLLARLGACEHITADLTGERTPPEAGAA